MPETQTTQPTQAARANAVRVLLSVYLLAVKESPGGQIPNGHLYAMLCGKVNLDTHSGVIAALVKTGLVTESNYLLSITEKGRTYSAMLERNFA